MFSKSWKATRLRFKMFCASTLSSICWSSFTYYKYRWNKVATQALDIKCIEDQRHELEVHAGLDPHQRSLRVSELGLTIIVKFTTN